MCKKILYFMLAVTMFLNSGLLSSHSVFADNKHNATNSNYWSETNPPEFYGTTKIVLKKGEKFSLKDSRFRIFARDFEDVDLTQNIKVSSNNVNTNQVGDYKITYSVTDSHGNTTTLDVPVKVLEDNEYSMIERTFYSLPTYDSLSKIGVHRNNNHDKQMLGFFLKNGASLHLRKINTTQNLKIQIFNNDSVTESSFDIRNNSWIEISNKTNAAPFYKTLTTSMAEPIKMEIAWDNDNQNIVPIQYYHYGDNQEEFLKTWEESTGVYGIIGNGVMMVYVPYADRPYLLNHWRKSFKTFDEFLDYYRKVYDRYDEILGVELNPENSVHQNVKAKWFVKANAHGAGAAYYGGDHIGINKPSVASFFEGNWGGLHELGHGYQGTLGNYMGLGETSNNIFAYYVQIDPSIYPFGDRNLQPLPRIEEAKQKIRLDGGTFNNLDDMSKLYFLISLFESIDSANTYTSIFKFFREQVANGVTFENGPDAYSLAIANKYGLNIMPYFNAWGLDNSSAVKTQLKKMDIKNIYPLKDLVVDANTLASIKRDLNITENYHLVTNDEISKYDLKGSLTLDINIDDINKLIGKKILLKDGQKVIKIIPITERRMVIENIPVGAYTLEIPSLIGEYINIEPEVTIIANKQNTQKSFVYEKLSNGNLSKNTVKIQFQGYYFNDAAEITLVKNKETNQKELFFKYRGTTLNYSNDSVWARIEVYDKQSNLIYMETVLKNQMFPHNVTKNLPVEPGYKIVLTNAYPNKLKFINLLTSEYIKELETTKKRTAYIITEDSIVKENMSNEDLYKMKADSYKKYINDFVKSVSEDDLKDKSLYLEEKGVIVEAYNFFNDEDKKLFEDIYKKITLGFEPVVTENPQNIEININNENQTDIDLYSLITVEDREDGAISLNEQNTQIKIIKDGQEVDNIDFSNGGNYAIEYTVFDSDKNSISTSLNIKIILEETTDIILNGKYFKTLKLAVDASQDGDTINILSSIDITEPIVMENKSIVLKSDKKIKLTNLTDSESMFTVENGNLTIRGASKEQPITIDANNKSRIIKVSNGTLTVINGNLQNGEAFEGGAIYSNNANIILENANIFENNATLGGAIYIDSGDLIAVTSRLYYNTSSDAGGAIWASNGIIKYSQGELFKNESQTTGGAIYVSNESISIEKSVLRNNVAKTGGGIYLDDNCKLTINGSGNDYIRNNIPTSEENGVFANPNNLNNVVIK